MTEDMADESEKTDSDTENEAGNSEGSASSNTPMTEERLIPEDQISDDGQVYVDRDGIDFDPEDGLLSGTAIDGSTDIPGPHEGETPDVDPEDSSESSDDAADSDSDAEGSDDSADE